MHLSIPHAYILPSYFFRCGEALTKNRQLVSGHEQQVEYHKELERNFYKFTERLAPLMGNANAKQSLISLRESYFSGFSAKPMVTHGNSIDLTNNGGNSGQNHSKATNGAIGGNGSNGQYGKYK